MLISEVSLTTGEPAVATEFWGRTLGLPTTHDGAGLRVRIGASTLAFRPGSGGGPAGAHHLAFTVARDRFDAGVAWLRARVDPIARDGVEVFPLSAPPWRSRSVYFRGPDAIVLELIARDGLVPTPPAGPPGPFTAADLLGVSEVGIAVPDVAAAVGELTATFGLTPFGDPSPDFAPLGDDHGLLIVVRAGRTWFPTAATTTSTGPLDVSVTPGTAAGPRWRGGACTVRSTAAGRQ